MQPALMPDYFVRRAIRLRKPEESWKHDAGRAKMTVMGDAYISFGTFVITVSASYDTENKKPSFEGFSVGLYGRGISQKLSKTSIFSIINDNDIKEIIHSNVVDKLNKTTQDKKESQSSWDPIPHPVLKGVF